MGQVPILNGGCKGQMIDFIGYNFSTIVFPKGGLLFSKDTHRTSIIFQFMWCPDEKRFGYFEVERVTEEIR
jgi:hypothetical protein